VSKLPIFLPQEGGLLSSHLLLQLAWGSTPPEGLQVSSQVFYSCGVSDTISQAPRDTLSSLAGGGNPGTLAPSIASHFLEPDLILPMDSMCSIPCFWDPMIEEAALGTTIAAPGHSFYEEIAIMVEQHANPPPTAMLPCLSNPLPHVDIQTPEIFRSEEEQLVGHELIEALSKFKLSKVPPLSPFSHHESSSNFEAIVVHPKENQSSYR
jgi:hypothetical protein